jgi:hypothetical protein
LSGGNTIYLDSSNVYLLENGGAQRWLR